MTTQKSKKPSAKTPTSKAKKATSKKTTSKSHTARAKKSTPKKVSNQHFEDVLTKEALKLLDEAATLLRNGIKASQKNTSKAREKAHKKAHGLLEKATRHLDDALKSSSSFLRQTINKL